METYGVPILQQYYKSQEIKKSNAEILQKVYSFLNN